MSRINIFIEKLRQSIGDAQDISSRARAFEMRLTRVGLEVCSDESGLYAVSSFRTATQPTKDWRYLSNTVFTLDEDKLPMVVAFGTPDLYYPSTEEMDKIIEEMNRGLYRIEEILFGTVCWWYYYNGEWRLGTKKRADARDLLLRRYGPSLSEAFKDALQAVSYTHLTLPTN